MWSFIRLRVLLFVLCFCAHPGLAQVNPPVAACGLPTSGAISAAVTYNLTDNCTLDAGGLSVADAGATEEVAITVNGNGFSINVPADTLAFNIGANYSLNLNNLTLVGGGRAGAAVVQTHGVFSSSITNVSFYDFAERAIRLQNSAETFVTHSLTGVHIENATGVYFSVDHGMPAGIHTVGRVNANIHDLVLRNIQRGNAAIGANESYTDGEPAGTGTITLTGCLTVDGVMPRVYDGNVVDNSSGECSDTVGNGGTGPRTAYLPAPVANCGLPLSGFVYESSVFNLSSDCVMDGTLYLPNEIDIVINGNGRTIDLSQTASVPFRVGGNFRISNVILSGSVASVFVGYLDTTMTFTDAVFRNNAGPLWFLDLVVLFGRVLFEGHSRGATSFGSAIVGFYQAEITIRDAVFRDNSGGEAAIYGGLAAVWAPSGVMTFEGCLTLSGNTPQDISDPNNFVTNNSTGACPDRAFTRIIEIQNPGASRSSASSQTPATPAASRRSSVCESAEDVQALELGAIGCVFRYSRQGDYIMQIYEVDSESRGFHKLTVAQSQLAQEPVEQIVATSPDGRVLVVRWADGNVTVKIGPDREGKIVQATFSQSIYGDMVDFRTTYGDAPGLPFVRE